MLCGPRYLSLRSPFLPRCHFARLDRLHTTTLQKITAGANSYASFFRTDVEHVESLGMYGQDDVQFVGNTPTHFTGRFGTGSWNLTKVYSELPTGSLRVFLSGPISRGTKKSGISSGIRDSDHMDL